VPFSFVSSDLSFDAFACCFRPFEILMNGPLFFVLELLKRNLCIPRIAIVGESFIFVSLFAPFRHFEQPLLDLFSLTFRLVDLARSFHLPPVDFRLPRFVPSSLGFL
jgi:hypothetical protein